MTTESKENTNTVSIQTVQKIIQYIEDNILETLTPKHIAKTYRRTIIFKCVGT